ncbi:MAG: hypothetical protein IJ153_00660 [Clostridia bacterium]|nr:hypothetical protein [Clostridia bacterium]
MKQLAELISQAAAAQVWQDDGAVKLYLYCFSCASHNDFKWRGLSLQPGDMPLSRRHAAEALIWSRNKLDRKLQALVAAGLVTVRSVPRTGTLVHIVHWPDAIDDDLAWLYDEARNEARWVAAGSMLVPETEPETKTAWPHDEASGQKAGSTMKTNWPHGEARKSDSGSTMETNPIKKNSTASLPPSEPQGFTDVWIAYPASRRNLRREAARLVAKALDEGATINAILSALEAEKQSYGWQEENGRFIPGIVKWLEKETWRSYVQQPEMTEEDEEWTSW